MPERLNSPEPVLERLWSRQIYSLRSHSASKIRPQIQTTQWQKRSKCQTPRRVRVSLKSLSSVRRQRFFLAGFPPRGCSCLRIFASRRICRCDPSSAHETAASGSNDTPSTGHTTSPASEPSNSALFLSQAEQRSERQCGCTALQITDAFDRVNLLWVVDGVAGASAEQLKHADAEVFV